MTDILVPDEPVYGLFSGGKDSFATAKALEEHDRLKGVVLIDTGIAADTWLEDVMDIVNTNRWQYEIVPTTTRFEWFVWKFGFPGPAMHTIIMRYLKGRAIAQWKAWHPGERLASGVRKDESDRRSLSAQPESDWEGVTVHAPLLNWTTKEVWAYVNQHNYQKPRTYITLGISGDCLCGAFAQPHEPEAIREYCPKAAQRIACMQSRDRYQWGERSYQGVDQTLDLPFDNAEAVACVDCKRGQ